MSTTIGTVFQATRAQPSRTLALRVRVVKSAGSGARRAASTSARATAPGASSSASGGAGPELNWPQYLSIRKQKRTWETGATIPLAIGGFAGGFAYFGSQDIDPTKPIFGVDPMMVYGFATVICGGLGALFGPTVGASIWRLTHRRSMALIEARERDFHRHVVKNRVDPSRQSATNPVPDFYGEKIGSLNEYRQWLRDQAKFRRKSRWTEE